MSENSPHQQVVNFNSGGAEDKLLLGIFLIALGETCFIFMGVFVRQASEAIPLMQIMFFRNFFALFFVGYAVSKIGFSTLKSDHHKMHFLRAVVGITSMFFMVYSFSELKLSEATLLKALAPIMIPLIAWLVLGEKLGLLTWLAILLAFAGVAVIIASKDVSLSANLGFTAGITSAFLASLAKVIVRKLGSTDPSQVIVFYFAAYGTLITAPFCFWFWTEMSFTVWGLVFLCALAATGGQLFVTRAYTIAKAGRVGMFSYVSMPIAGILGWLIWSEKIPYSLVIGSLMIVAAGYLNYQEFKHAKKQVLSQ